jgi:hypothetical protein
LIEQGYLDERMPLSEDQTWSRTLAAADGLPPETLRAFLSRVISGPAAE